MIGFARNALQCALQPGVTERSFFLKFTSPRLCRPGVVGRVYCSRSKISCISDSKITKRICKRCKKEYIEEENHERACQYHSLNWSGGEIAKVITDASDKKMNEKCIDRRYALASHHWYWLVKERLLFCLCAQAHGFLRASEDLTDQLKYKLGTGLISFWDCCGKESYDSPGCTYGRHVAYGEEDQYWCEWSKTAAVKDAATTCVVRLGYTWVQGQSHGRARDGLLRVSSIGTLSWPAFAWIPDRLDPKWDKPRAFPAGHLFVNTTESLYPVEKDKFD